MGLTARQWAQIAVTLGVLGAAGVGGVVATTPTAPNVGPVPSQTAVAAVVKWPATIAVDTQTGQLQPGFVNGRYGGSRRGVYYCGVATQTFPTFKRVLTTSAVAPTLYNFACRSAFTQWDSAETASGGRWPAP
jgi:hypothetical protein